MWWRHIGGLRILLYINIWFFYYCSVRTNFHTLIYWDLNLKPNGYHFSVTSWVTLLGAQLYSCPNITWPISIYHYSILYLLLVYSNFTFLMFKRPLILCLFISKNSNRFEFMAYTWYVLKSKYLIGIMHKYLLKLWSKSQRPIYTILRSYYPLNLFYK